MADDFVQQIARLLGQSPEDTHRTLHALADSIRNEVENEGEASIEGLGVFRRDGEALAFDPAPSLSQAVNHRYAGLPALTSGGGAEPDAESQAEVAEVQAAASETEPSVTEPAPPEAPAVPETEAFAAEADPFAAADEPDLDLPAEAEADPIRDLSSEPGGLADDSSPVIPEVETEVGETDGGESPETTADVSAPLSASEAQLDPDPSVTPEAEMVEEETATGAVADPLAEELTFLEALGSSDDEESVSGAFDDVTLEGEMLDEDAISDDAAAAETATDDAPKEEPNDLLEGVWDDALEPSDAEHDVGGERGSDATDSDDGLDRYRDADPLLRDVSDVPPAGTAMPDAEAPDATDASLASENDLVEDHLTDSAVEEESAEEDEPLSVLTAGLAPDPTPVSDEPADVAPVAAEIAVPVEADGPAETVPAGPAPAFAATAAKHDDTEVVASHETRSRAPLFLGVAAVLLVALALFWFMGRDADPVIAPGDQVATTRPDDSSIDPATPEEPVPDATTPDETPAEAGPAAPPPPSTDPLRSTDGIDQAAGGFTWVIASEASRAAAERRVAAFREQGIRADVIPGESNGRTRYRVGLGQFESLDEANRYRSDLPADVPEGTWVLRL